MTPVWWDDLWLNEGFASYVENLGIEHAEPSLKIMDQFVTNEIQYVFNPDSLANSHPIYQVRVPRARLCVCASVRVCVCASVCVCVCVYLCGCACFKARVIFL